MTFSFRWLAAISMAIFVAACGGGGGGDGTANIPTGTNPPTGGNNPPSSGQGGVWEAVNYATTTNDLISQLSAQGARGYYFYGTEGFSSSNTNDFRNLYVKDSNTTYTYEVLPDQTTAATLLAQMNSQGARGFDFYGPTTLGVIYIKENGSQATYTYQFLNASSTNAGFLSQANAQGTNGYFYAGGYIFPGNSQQYAIYTKLSNSNAVYSYRLLPTVSDPGVANDLVTQANAQGQEGYKFIGGEFFEGEPVGSATRSRNLYVKDTTQAATFSWKALDVANSSSTFLTQANTEGASNSYYWGGWASFPNGSTASPLVTVLNSLYFKGSNCTGMLCRAASPL
jgi:hypothetical protein